MKANAGHLIIYYNFQGNELMKYLQPVVPGNPTQTSSNYKISNIRNRITSPAINSLRIISMTGNCSLS